MPKGNKNGRSSLYTVRTVDGDIRLSRRHDCRESVSGTHLPFYCGVPHP